MKIFISRVVRHVLACLLPAGDDALTRSILMWPDEQERAGQLDLLNRQVLQDRSESSSDDIDMSACVAERMPRLTRLILALRVHHGMQIDDIARTFQISPCRVHRHLPRAVAIVARSRSLTT